MVEKGAAWGEKRGPLRRDAGLSGVGLGIGRRWTDQDR